MTLMTHAINELKSIGMWDSADEMDQAMLDNIIELIETFTDQGHSGFSASYILNIFDKLANYKPLGPLTGEDDEWNDVGEISGYTLYQNKRRGSVFKEEDEVYDIDGKVFWEWFLDSEGNTIKTYYTNSGCRVPVTFPYTVPEKPIYEYRQSDAEPRTPTQTEEGLI